jgi:predicted nuclease of predicted toxin-antitoxin system
MDRVMRVPLTLGHDVVPSVEAGQENRRVLDAEVLKFAASMGRILITQDRRDFRRLRDAGSISPRGMLLCTVDADFAGQARRIHEAVARYGGTAANVVIRI